MHPKPANDPGYRSPRLTEHARCETRLTLPPAETPAADEAPAADEVPADFKVGFITLHDENSTYDLNFINAAKEACRGAGR